MSYQKHFLSEEDYFKIKQTWNLSRKLERHFPRSETWSGSPLPSLLFKKILEIPDRLKKKFFKKG